MSENYEPNIPKTDRDFAWFVNQVHKPLTSAKNNLELSDANKYADRGVEFLISLLNSNEDINTNSSVDAANCILWALIRFSYQNDYVFGKGMFNIIFSEDVSINNKAVKRLNNFLSKKGYSRLSSHYPDAIISSLASKPLGLSMVRGIDIDHSTIPFPAKFETILFAQINLHDPNDKRIALAFKPETSSFDLSRPQHAFQHMRNWIESSKNLTDRTPGETKSYREKESKANKEYAENSALKATELVCRVTNGGLKQEKQHRLISKRDLDIV